MIRDFDIEQQCAAWIAEGKVQQARAHMAKLQGAERAVFAHHLLGEAADAPHEMTDPRPALALAKLALDNGATLGRNLALDDNRTPLFAAITHGNLAMVKLLVGRGACIKPPPDNPDNHRGLTPLLFSIGMGVGLVEYLLSAGANPHECSLSGENALHRAAHLGLIPEIKRFHALGVDPHQPNCRGENLFHAVLIDLDSRPERHAVNLLNALFELGVEPHAPSHSGKTPHQLARKWPGTRVLRTMEEGMARLQAAQLDAATPPSVHARPRARL